MSVKSPDPVVVAALVAARNNRGVASLRGDHGKGAHAAIKAGLAERVVRDGVVVMELNMRGQDVADEAMSLAASAKGAAR